MTSFRTRAAFVSATALLLAGSATPGMAAPEQAAGAHKDAGVSPAMCGAGDEKEPGIQGDVPAGQKVGNYNCGVRLIGQLPIVGNVQGTGQCVYVRTRGTVHIVDVSDPTKPVETGTIPVLYGSESMRVNVNKDRALLVSGSSVYDIKDCLHPVLLGEIKWPPLSIGIAPPVGGGGGAGILPHDLRINRAGTRVYAAMGLWEADISNLNDPKTWTITDHRCELAAQVPGPWQELHRQTLAAGISLCDDTANPKGANWRVGGSGMQTAAMWPTLSHSPDVSGDDKYVYVGDQAGGASGKLAGGKPHLRIIDVTQHPFKIVGVTDGPGHGLDWFRTGGREYVVHSNEGGTNGIGGQPGSAGDTCKPYPRPTALGWGFEAIVSDVTVPARAHNISMLRVAINDAENCAARKASGKDPTIAYHLIDNPYDAHFAAVNFGSAGLRIFDIRQPLHPSEVAYFNHGPLVHAGVGAYDAKRGLIYAAGGTGLWVLQIEPQVKAKLGL